MSNNQRKKKGTRKTNDQPIISQPPYFYWDSDFKNKDGLSLRECYERFGTKMVLADKFYYKVVYLDKKKDLGHSWMLWSKDINTDNNIRLTQYEKDPTKIFVGDI